METEVCEKCGLEKPKDGESAIGKLLCLCGARLEIVNGVPTVIEEKELEE